MTVLVEGTNSYFLGTQAILLDDSRETAASWANDHIVSNKALKWVLGKYVEADNANFNGQYWSLADLQMKSPTIQYSPMNMNHQQNKIVGTFVASEMMYPTGENAEAAHPFIETLGAFWKYYFPDELEEVEEAFKNGECFLSMECVSDTVTCGGPSGCGETFDYAGPRSESYCAHLLGPDGVKQLNNPHFLAGALIIPPASPGWGGASVKSLATLIKTNADKAEKIYNDIAEEMPHLDAKRWEQLMAEVLRKSKGVTLDDPRLPRNKIPADAIGRRIARDSIKSRA